jgi:DNA-binding transcriptional MerR regulator
MIQNEYLIQDLKEITGLEPRTIRYYQEKGLLPMPEYRGKNAYYNDDHLVRLKLILVLKKTYLPLDEIAKQLNSLSYEQVRNLVEKPKDEVLKQVLHRDVSKGKTIEPSPEAAIDYISSVLHPESESRKLEFKQGQLYQMTSNRYIGGTPTESWQRILLTPGIEIQFRETLSPADKKRLEELIRLAKSIFT